MYNYIVYMTIAICIGVHAIHLRDMRGGSAELLLARSITQEYPIKVAVKDKLLRKGSEVVDFGQW